MILKPPNKERLLYMIIIGNILFESYGDKAMLT